MSEQTNREGSSSNGISEKPKKNRPKYRAKGRGEFRVENGKVFLDINLPIWEQDSGENGGTRAN